MRIGRMSAWTGLLALAVLLPAKPASAQANPGDRSGGTAAPAEDREDQTAAQASFRTTLQRWFDLQTASFIGRYRLMETSDRVVTSNDVQDSISLKARFKFDAAANYTVTAVVGTGSAFTSGWNNTGLGRGTRATDTYVKQLFVTAAPLPGVALSAGGLGFVRGESTEITTYDNDGYLVGERVRVSRRSQLWLDEITFTNAYLGDLDTPGVIGRYHRLGKTNYRHLLAGKQVGPHVAVSADYTRSAGVGTMRAAISVKTPRARVVDLVQWEQYRRGGTNAAFGFGAFAEKTIAGRVIPRVGYADIDGAYGGLNADKFRVGRRWYAQSDFVITPDVTAWVFVTRAFHSAFEISNRTRFDFVVTFNALGPLRRAGLFR